MWCVYNIYIYTPLLSYCLLYCGKVSGCQQPFVMIFSCGLSSGFSFLSMQLQIKAGRDLKPIIKHHVCMYICIYIYIYVCMM